jgi:hypothetical protein
MAALRAMRGKSNAKKKEIKPNKQAKISSMPVATGRMGGNIATAVKQMRKLGSSYHGSC